MRTTIVSLAAAAALLAACAQDPEATSSAGGTGDTATTTDTTTTDTVLERLAGWMRQYGNIALTLEGHADERGTREYNLALGERRANAVKDYLASLGIAADRLFVVSFGKERPAVLGANEAAWEQNRRSVFVIR